MWSNGKRSRTQLFFLSFVSLCYWSAGTTLIAAHYNGGVIIGADSKTSRGTYIASSSANKICKLTDQICIARSGSSADTQQLAEDIALDLASLAQKSDNCLPRVGTVANLLRNKCYEGKDSLQSSLLVVGYDDIAHTQVYIVPQGGALFKSDTFAISGSGSSFIYGWCDENWRPGLSSEECVQFVITALRLASQRDSSSGAPFKLLCIENGKQSRWLECSYSSATFPGVAYQSS